MKQRIKIQATQEELRNIFESNNLSEIDCKCNLCNVGLDLKFFVMYSIRYHIYYISPTCTNCRKWRFENRDKLRELSRNLTDQMLLNVISEENPELSLKEKYQMVFDKE